MADTVKVTCTRGELELLCSALDSHMYWELSDRQYRSSGYVMEPGSDDEDAAREIVDAGALASRLGEELRALERAKCAKRAAKGRARASAVRRGPSG